MIFKGKVENRLLTDFFKDHIIFRILRLLEVIHRQIWKLGKFIIKLLLQLSKVSIQVRKFLSMVCDSLHQFRYIFVGALEFPNLLRSSVYCNSEWDGGVYGTPSDAGSQSCTAALKALVSMLAMGRKGYIRAAKKIHSHALEFAKTIRRFDGKLKLLAYPEVNVVTLTMDGRFGLEKGAIYAFAHEMAERGFIFNTMPGDCIHFCVTLRYVWIRTSIKNCIRL
jgi:hypothetical protein